MDLATIDAKLAGSNLWPAERANLNILREQLAHQSPKERLNHMNVLAIDPGPTDSAYVIIDPNYHALAFGKIDNRDLLAMMGEKAAFIADDYDTAVIEMVASYGMAVGAEVFETCVWIGRFQQALTMQGHQVTLTNRLAVKKHLCHNGLAKDGNIIQALVDRFAGGIGNHGKGTKSAKGFFYGFHSDIWQAFALAVTHLDLHPPAPPPQVTGYDQSELQKQFNNHLEHLNNARRTAVDNLAANLEQLPAKTQGIGSDWAPVDLETR